MKNKLQHSFCYLCKEKLICLAYSCNVREISIKMKTYKDFVVLITMFFNLGVPWQNSGFRFKNYWGAKNVEIAGEIIIYNVFYNSISYTYDKHFVADLSLPFAEFKEIYNSIRRNQNV